jgi:hypothetical protein
MATSEELDNFLSKEKIENALKLLNGDIDTPTIKRTFASFFKGTNYDVYTIIQGYDDTEGLLTQSTEWLYDLIVTQEVESEIHGESFLTDSILVLESEISDNFKGVMYDFQKLLISNSLFKVIVFRYHSTELDLYIDYMKRNIKSYKSANGKFFLIGYLNDGGQYSVSEVPVI